MRFIFYTYSDTGIITLDYSASNTADKRSKDKVAFLKFRQRDDLAELASFQYALIFKFHNVTSDRCERTEIEFVHYGAVTRRNAVFLLIGDIEILDSLERFYVETFHLRSFSA